VFDHIRGVQGCLILCGLPGDFWHYADRGNYSATIFKNNKGRSRPKQQGQRGSRRRGPQRGKRKKKTRSRTKLSPVARMIADPCNAVLVPGCFTSSEGYLARLRDTINNNSVGVAGYVLWAPMYHNNNASPVGLATNFNLFGFTAVDSSVSPVNAAHPSFPYGAAINFANSLQNGTAFGIPDPASSIVGVGNAIVQDARLISACMNMTYTGPMAASQGEFCYVRIPLTTLLGDVENGQLPISVDEIFRMSSNRQRLGVDTIEVVHRPETELTELFHESQDACMQKGGSGDPTIPITQLGPTAELRQVNVFGLAWRALSPDNNANLTFEFTKNIEWRPAPKSGFVASVPRNISGGGSMQRAVTALDNAIPNWDKRLLSAASSGISQVAQMAFTGALAYASSGASNMLLH
jgi:hypothetical protein